MAHAMLVLPTPPLPVKKKCRGGLSRNWVITISWKFESGSTAAIGHVARQFTDVVGISPSEYRRTAIGRTLTETSPWPSATHGSPESKGPLTTGVP